MGITLQQTGQSIYIPNHRALYQHKLNWIMRNHKQRWTLRISIRKFPNWPIDIVQVKLFGIRHSADTMLWDVNQMHCGLVVGIFTADRTATLQHPPTRIQWHIH